jgi:heat-inducible transcriptional repressor
LSLVNASIASADRGTDIVIEGQSRLLDRHDFASPEHLKELMHVLEDRERVVMLLDRMLSSDRVQVFLGEDTAEAVGHPVSLVAARFSEDGRPSGAVGVIGPTRMDYPRVVPLVGATADAVSAALSRGREGTVVRPPELVEPDSGSEDHD